MQYKYVDFFDTYGRIMQFNKNKTEPVHRWYPFVEGYSKEFIQSIVSEVRGGGQEIVCLEPFSGSGTTALELQNLGIKCISFEVNPLMYLISKVKLRGTYSYDKTKAWLSIVMKRAAESPIDIASSQFPTLYENEAVQKWNIDQGAAVGVEKLKQAIFSIGTVEYKELFIVALAAILLEISNLYRNGKCLSYKENWKEVSVSQQDVFDLFHQKIVEELLPDIKSQEDIREKETDKTNVQNGDYLFLEDSRNAISKFVKDQSIDLVITSPPYLNSRDYTDTYMLELKALGFTKTLKDITELRNKTIRSHVQIKWNDPTNVENSQLAIVLHRLKEAEKNNTAWNRSIPDMVRLYFVDMQKIFQALSNKVKPDGKVFFNVSNSAYYGIEINTLDICASLAERQGFEIEEIRKARLLKTSPQQKKSVNKLLEGVIVMKRTIQ